MSMLPLAEWMSLPVVWDAALSGLLYAAALVLIVVGIMGCVLPYPGHLVIWGGCALWAYSHGEPYPSVWLWVLLALLALLGCVADNLCSLVGAKRFGCSRAAMWCSVAGMIVGLFFPPIGLFAGPFIGAFVGELLLSNRSWGASAKSSVGVLVGILCGMGVKFLIAGGMLLLFMLW